MRTSVKPRKVLNFVVPADAASKYGQCTRSLSFLLRAHILSTFILAYWIIVFCCLYPFCHTIPLSTVNCQRCAGAEPNMLDFHMWPWFERVPYMDVLLPKESLPKLNQWAVSMRELDAVKATGAFAFYALFHWRKIGFPWCGTYMSHVALQH